MKKLLCLTIALAFGATTFAQRTYQKINHPKANEAVQATYQAPNDPAVEATAFTPPENMVQVQTNRSSMNYEETHIWTAQYDLQTNAALGNRVYQWPDGTVGAVATWSTDDITGTRGAGYNFFDGTSWGPLPTQRVEPVYSGWPTYAAVGENGEGLASHGGTPFGINFYKREIKGEGDWVQKPLPPNPEGFELTWPRLISSGENNNHLHVVATDQVGNDPLFYTFSTDGGETWNDWMDMPALDSEFYNWNHSADDYVFASNGDVVVLAFFSAWMDIFYLKSTDGGENWEHHVVWEHPYPTFDWDLTITTDTLYAPDNSGHVAIDNDGLVHMVWGVARVGHNEPGTTYQYWPITDGVGYWNETMGQIPTHPENPHWTLSAENLDEMGMLVGWVPDEDGDGEVNIFDFEVMSYRALGLSTYPTIAIDDVGTIVVAYATVSETRNNGEFYYKSIYASYKDGVYGTWYPAEDNLMDNFIHLFDEGYGTTAAARAYDNTFWLIYNADNTPGLALDEDHPYQDNFMFAVKLNPVVVGLNQYVNPITNISSAYPNPASGSHVYFDLSLSKASNNIVVDVYNLAGQLVSQQKMSASMGMERIAIETNNLQSGVYFTTITVDNYKETRKFVVK